LLREVLDGDDGTKTVVIDMRDGSTRRFQTMVDWFDKSPTLSDPSPQELIDLREEYEAQGIALELEMRKAMNLDHRVSELQGLLSTAESALADANDAAALVLADVSEQATQAQEEATRLSSTLTDAQEAKQALVAAEAKIAALRKELSTKKRAAQDQEEKLVEALEENGDQRERIKTLESLLEETREELASWQSSYGNQLALTEAAEATGMVRFRAWEASILERDRWKEQYATASRVIDESLPAIADLLAERTDEITRLQAELEGLR
jgi:chromosome segregation ATPase